MNLLIAAPDWAHVRLAVLSLLAVCIAGCSTQQGAATAPTPTETHVVAPPSTGFTTAQTSIHLAYLRARSYTPDRHLTVPVAKRHVLFAVHSVCTGSADGHCQAIDAFLDGRRDPIFHHEYSAVSGMQRIQNGFLVAAQSYRTGDPLCCPTGPTVRDRYVWNGHSLDESGPLPRDPSG